ncbi:cytosine permease [Vibrio sp. PP-XX7]
MTQQYLKDASPNLINADLAPDIEQTWGWYGIFAFWMSDVHSVGGYVFAASLFALGLAGWQVFVCLLAGIMIVYLFANLMGVPGQKAGIPFPVVCRLSFGVKGGEYSCDYSRSHCCSLVRHSNLSGVKLVYHSGFVLFP